MRARITLSFFMVGFRLLLAIMLLAPCMAWAQPDLDTLNSRVRFYDTLDFSNQRAATILERASFWLKSTHSNNIVVNNQTNTISANGKTFIGRPLSAPLIIYYTLNGVATDSSFVYNLQNIQLADGNTPNNRYPADSTIIAEEKARPYPNPVTEKLRIGGLTLERWMERKPTLSDTAAPNQFSAFYYKQSRKNAVASGFFATVGLAATAVMISQIHKTNGTPQIFAGVSVLSIATAVLTGVKALEYRKIARQEDAFTK